MKRLNRAEMAQLQEATATLKTRRELGEFIKLIHRICEWAGVETPDWAASFDHEGNIRTARVITYFPEEEVVVGD